jgi:hypothetical protein
MPGGSSSTRAGCGSGCPRDRVLQSLAWKAAILPGWPGTFDAEYAAPTQLHADAVITPDRQLAGAVKDLVKVAPIEALY